MGYGWLLAKSSARAVGIAVSSRVGRFRSWPSTDHLIDEPLALAEAETHKLRRIYTKAQEHMWDGPKLFREAVHKHGGIQLSEEKRVALSHLITMLMWGELAAWIVSAELAERLDDSDARMAASSQVFDEARHFYTLRDYLALLHVPVPKLDPYFAIAARTLLDSRDLDLKLFAMQILAEGTAQAIFNFLAKANVEPVLSELLPYIERDEARHVGLGIMHLPDRLNRLSESKRRQLAGKILTIGDLFAATQMRYAVHYQTLGLDPRELFRRADTMLGGLSDKLGRVPGTGEPYFRTFDPNHPSYEANLDIAFPRPGVPQPRFAVVLKRVLEFGARVLPS
jgi:rubrerythrin